MNELKEGLKLLEKDERDFQLGSIINWPNLSELPVSYVCNPFSIKDQLADGNQDFCAAAASTGMIEPKEGVELYYPYVFAAAKDGNDPSSWGLSLRDVGRAICNWGVPAKNIVPPTVLALSDTDKRVFSNYPQDLRIQASIHRGQTFFFVDGPYDPFDNARAAEWYFKDKKQNIIFGVLFGWSLNQSVLDGFPQGFGHAMWMNGWDGDYITCVNSAGRLAGIDGVHKMTRETFNKYAKDYGLMMIIDLPRDDVQNYYLAHGITLDDNTLIAFLKAILSWIPFLKRLWQ